MIKKWLSAYNFRYPRFIVYMLQASEYDIRHYLTWYGKTGNFIAIEKRKKLVKTSKAVFLLVIGWIITIVLIALAALIFLIGKSLPSYILSVLIIILLPYFLAYGIIVPLLIFKVVIQLPIERRIISIARKKLDAHRGIKIGIAGSYGKTTMREILKTVLSEGKIVAAPPHSYNTLLGISRFIGTLKGDEDVIIFELGEYYPGDIMELCELVKPGIGIITGINEAHLDKFVSLDKTVRTIFELADYLGERKVYVNGENKLASQNVRSGHILYAKNRLADWKIENPKSDLTGTSFIMTNSTIRLELWSKLLGLHQIGPLAVAVDLGLRLGLSSNQIKKGIDNTKPFEHRLDPKTDDFGVVTLDDSYNGNPDGVKADIEFLASLKNHRRFYVTPGLVEMGHMTEEVHKQIGKLLAEARIEKIILIRNSVTLYIEQGLKENEYAGELLWFNDAPAAFSAIPNLTVKGDVLLLQNDWPDQY